LRLPVIITDGIIQSPVRNQPFYGRWAGTILRVGGGQGDTGRWTGCPEAGAVFSNVS